MASHRVNKHLWREYKTADGDRPVKEFLDSLSPKARELVRAEIQKVRSEGVRAARHLKRINKTNKHLYEVRRKHEDLTYRILFVPVGKHKNVFLALGGFVKKTQKTPPREIATAINRLRIWEERGRASVK